MRAFIVMLERYLVKQTPDLSIFDQMETGR